MRLPRYLLVPVALVAAVVLAPPVAADDPAMTSEYVFGYNVGAVPRQTAFTSVSAVWNVAAAASHGSGEDEAARAWISLGGGCVTYDCRVQDNLALYVGTESAVDASGEATYRAWYRVTPLPVTFTPLTVAAGDRVRGTIERLPSVPALWRISLRNLTTGAFWTTTTPAAPVWASARWVVESNVLTDEFGTGYPLLPDLDVTQFDEITLNGANPNLQAAERVVFVPALTTDVVGTPSLPQPDGNGFGACAWATTCAVPADF